MPSARELLEQADALMRRNRSPLMDDIPVLTDSVPEARPGQPARLRPAQPSAPDSIPMLTERVPSAPAQPPAAPAAPTPPPNAATVAEEGEPSDWLQLGEAEPSITGEAPDSIATVPPFEDTVAEEIELRAPPYVEESFDAELAEREREAAPPPEPAPPEPVAPPEPEPASLSWKLEAEQSSEPAAMDVWSDMVADRPEAEELGASEGERLVELAMPPADQGAPVVAAVEPVPSAADRQAAEDARWASMAEEIRMQVLQRIDLFTDTGLRDQLGARLQPIVDRASADLVATINQRVGELLRAYVAEAIEREIENWRKSS